MTKKLGSPEDLLAHLSDDAVRASGEGLAAHVLAATVISCLGASDAIPDTARALLAHMKRERGDESAHLVSIAEAHLEELLRQLQAKRIQ